VDLREINQMINAFTRLLEIRGGSNLDYNCLNIITDAILALPTDDINRKLLQQLLDKIGNSVSNPHIWGIQAKVLQACGQNDKVLETYQKQLRSVQTSGWESEPKGFESVVAAAENVLKAVLLPGNEQNIYSIKLSFRSLLGKAKETFVGTEHYLKLEKFYDTLNYKK